MYTPILIALFLALAAADKCPSGGEIYARGINEAGKSEVVKSHNKFRKMIANGEVAGQPRGINLKRLGYDEVLGEKGHIVSDTCNLKHHIAKDDRWSWVGQNLYIEMSSVNDPHTQNWDKAVQAWFDENTDFIYPNTSQPGTVTGHYTQVVWADTEKVGCDFIAYYNPNRPSSPYTKLYTCNYGIGGNRNGAPPYATGNSGCENLC